jgi:hypothetical protein
MLIVRMINELERKQSWPHARYYPGICLEGLKKTIKTSVRIDSLQAET